MYNANVLNDNEKIGKFNIKNNEKIIAICDIKRYMIPSS